jgi:hypothetical protein
MDMVGFLCPQISSLRHDTMYRCINYHTKEKNAVQRKFDTIQILAHSCSIINTRTHAYMGA